MRLNKGFLSDIKKNGVLLLMTLPTTILLIIFNYIPMFGVILPFKKMDYSKGLFGSEWSGLANFKFLTLTPDFLIYVRNTLLYNLTFIIVGLVLSIAFAIALSEMRNPRGRKFYQSAGLLPYFFSWIIAGYILYAFLNPQYGKLNQILLTIFGIQQSDWYMNKGAWPFIIVIIFIWKNIGYSTVVYFAAIAGIDATMYEAAVIDGASKWQQIRNITIPFLKPLMIVLVTLAMGRIFNADFGLFYTATMNMGNGMLKPAVGVLDTYVYTALSQIGDVGMASAGAFGQSVVGFITLLSANLIIRKVDPESSLF